MATVRILANGAYAGNGFNAPTVTGTQPVVGDDDDATYLTFPEGGGNATVGLEIPAGTPVAPLYLHLRMTVVVSDPTGFAGTGEVFLNTQANGSSGTEFAGFSDGAVSGFGFNLPAGVATGIVDFNVGMNLTPWSPTTFSDVVTALAAGAYLDFNAWSWTGGSFTPTFRVYEAWLEYEATSGAIPPRRIFQRRDGATHGAPSLFGSR